MNKTIYSNGSFDVFEYFCNVNGKQMTAYGIRRTDRPQDGMIFSSPDSSFTIRIADSYKKTLTKD